MKRVLFILIFILVASFLITPELQAGTGFGVIVGAPTGLSVRIDNFPVIGIAWNMLSADSFFHTHVDYWIINDDFVDPLKWYLGVGGKLKIWPGTKPEKSPVGLSVRIPVGVQWYPDGDIEIFAEVAPGLQVIPASRFDFDFAVGIRFYP